MLKGLENQTYLVAYLISNGVALVLLYCASLWPRVTRGLFLGLFAWASWVNWTTALSTPQVYVDYASLAFLDLYKDFITGWFSDHVVEVVGTIATVQGLIALSMGLKGWAFKAGAAGAILFLVAIGPLGVGSAFPCTLIMALAMGILLARPQGYLWKPGAVRNPMSVSYPWRIN
jgi:hypothetical protein